MDLLRPVSYAKVPHIKILQLIKGLTLVGSVGWGFVALPVFSLKVG